ncbi:MAG: hypothetical protein IJR99_01080 [Kiritimatiellae bacterium]|nr:hypothetical protein [Kiritimatiellia bacterium]
MVRQLDRFLEFFRDWKSSFAVIGGCACSQWFSESAVRFRSTQDIDMVLLLKAKESGFFARFWEYIRKGRYELIRRAHDDSTILFRFERPGAGEEFPKRIELLTGIPDLEIPVDVRIVHLTTTDGQYSLSAILLQAEYYNLVASGGTVTKNGMPTVRPDVLAILKAKAHLNLLAEKRAGRFVSEHDLTKHRNDVFQLAYLFRDRYEQELPQPIRNDMAEFLSLHSVSNPEWTEIQAHLRAFAMETRPPEELLQLIRDHFRI